MSIDLEAFREAKELVEVYIIDIRQGGIATVSHRTADVLQWMLVQIDDLTKKVAELEAKCEEQDRFSAMRPIG